MTVVLVGGGAGNAGRRTVGELLARGARVRVLSRSGLPPADGAGGPEYIRGNVLTGEGLADAVRGADVVVDTLDGKFGRDRKVLTAGAANLARAAEEAGVKRLVLLSVLNEDRGAFGYYRAKTRQRDIYAASSVPLVEVAATQFHDLVASVFDTGLKVGVLPAFRGVSFQPVATQDVARVLAEAALAPLLPGRRNDGGAGQGPRLTIAGPEILSMRRLAEQYRACRDGRGRIMAVPLPGAFGRFLRAGLNLAPESPKGAVTFADWLERPVRG